MVIIQEHFDEVLSVTTSRADGVYQVRVLQLWKVPDSSSSGTFGSIVMILMDIRKHRIEAVIPSHLIPVFEDQINLGRVYKISSLTVELNIGCSFTTFHRYKFIFNEKTVVEPSSNYLIPTYGFCLIDSEDVLKKKERKECYPYLVDVIGIVTRVRHQKDFHPDLSFVPSVTFRLNDLRRSFCCELYGGLVDQFKERVGNCIHGLPVVVLQFVKINCVQGRTLVQGVPHITKIHVNPAGSVDVLNFRKRMVLFLRSSPNFGGILRSSRRMPLSHALDFISSYPVRTIAELIAERELGTFILNARMVDIVRLDPWWYAGCDCKTVFEGYIGEFSCSKCNVAVFEPTPKVKLTVKVEDETGDTLFKSFDHVMNHLAVVEANTQVLSREGFYRAFCPVRGQSMMWIVKKTSNETNFFGSSFEVVRVSNQSGVIDYFKRRNLYNTPSMIIGGRMLADEIDDAPLGPLTTTTNDVLYEYHYGHVHVSSGNNDASTSRGNVSTSRGKRSRLMY